VVDIDFARAELLKLLLEHVLRRGLRWVRGQAPVAA
jgi:hypothetical protein